jgi:hypothetical protein
MFDIIEEKAYTLHNNHHKHAMIENISSSIAPPSYDRHPEATAAGCGEKDGPSLPSKAQMHIDHIGMTDLDTNPEIAEQIRNISEVGSVLLDTGANLISESGIKGTLATAAKLGTALSGAYLGIHGVIDMTRAVKERSLMKGITAGGELSLASSAAIDTAQAMSRVPAMGKIIGPAATSFVCSPAMAVAGKCAGLLYAATEFAEGGAMAVKGYKEHDRKKIFVGALNVGLGIAATTLFTVGGIPATLAFGALALTELLVVGRDKVEEVLKGWQEKHRGHVNGQGEIGAPP